MESLGIPDVVDRARSAYARLDNASKEIKVWKLPLNLEEKRLEVVTLVENWSSCLVEVADFRKGMEVFEEEAEDEDHA